MVLIHETDASAASLASASSTSSRWSDRDSTRGKRHLEEGADRHRAEVAAIAQADRDRVLSRLSLADHQHVRDLLQLRFADLGLHAIAPIVDFDAQVPHP